MKIFVYSLREYDEREFFDRFRFIRLKVRSAENLETAK